jgi:hypothetical protein
MRPCFAAIRQGQQKMSDTEVYNQLREARSDRDKALVERIMRDSVEILQGALGIESTSVEDVTDVATNSVEESEF